MYFLLIFFVTSTFAVKQFAFFDETIEKLESELREKGIDKRVCNDVTLESAGFYNNPLHERVIDEYLESVKNRSIFKPIDNVLDGKRIKMKFDINCENWENSEICILKMLSEIQKIFHPTRNNF